MNTAKRKILHLDGNNELVEEEIKPSQNSSAEKLSKGKVVNNFALGGELGFSIVIPIVGGVLLGAYLDKKFNWEPRLTLSFLFLGVIIAFMNIIYILRENK